jgi:hypothetical protein
MGSEWGTVIQACKASAWEMGADNQWLDQDQDLGYGEGLRPCCKKKKKKKKSTRMVFESWTQQHTPVILPLRQEDV